MISNKQKEVNKEINQSVREVVSFLTLVLLKIKNKIKCIKLDTEREITHKFSLTNKHLAIYIWVASLHNPYTLIKKP